MMTAGTFACPIFSLTPEKKTSHLMNCQTPQDTQFELDYMIPIAWGISKSRSTPLLYLTFERFASIIHGIFPFSMLSLLKQ